MTSTTPREVVLEIGLDEPDDEASIARHLARELSCDVDGLPPFRLLKRSLDARRGRIRFRLLYGVGDLDSAPLGGAPLREVRAEQRVIVVGDGPAGLFAAYELARHGVGAVVVDRGKPVQPRRRDLKGLNRQGFVDPDSNYCFGEGGAGTYSDGKLYTRAHKRGPVRDVLEILALHGAPPEILTEARPHIGSNRLPKVVTALREALEGVGVRFEFSARVTALLVEESRGRRRAVGVRLADGREFDGIAVVLATGHSARDVFDSLAALDVRLELKPFAMGVRIEHPQRLINRIQYGSAAGHPKLPAAAYRLAVTIEERGVFSFCMCPGGFIVPASTEPDGVVVNGMSLSRRDSPFANSGLVVAIDPNDVGRAGMQGPLAGVRLQRTIERAAAEAGGGALRAPATRVTDFCAGRASSTLPRSSYQPGLTASNVADVLDSAGLPLAERLRRALVEFGRTLRGYLSDEAVLVGVESRTSAPVRVPRHPERLVSLDIDALYPAGEGAGYAGGIVSAAVDGMRIGSEIVRHITAAP